MDNKYSKLYEKGLKFMKKGEFFNAILSFNDCVHEGAKDADLWVNIANSYRELKRYEYVESCLDYVMGIQPNNSEGLKLRASLLSEAFGHRFFEDPIKNIRIEGSSKQERCIQALNFFQPFLLLNNSEIGVVKPEICRRLGLSKEGEKNTVHIAIKGEMGKFMIYPAYLVADVQQILYQVEPSIHVAWVKFG